ncbi:MAG: four helix bundle protein [Chloroflexi bacterium]|nr:four helix bundle protein [Chloroflexota bacterium]
MLSGRRSICQRKFSRIEFARFLGIARRSAVEIQSLLYAALDVGYINQEHLTHEHSLHRKFPPYDSRVEPHLQFCRRPRRGLLHLH